MGILATAQRASHTPSLTVASLVIVIPAFEVLKIWRLEAIGMASAAAAGEAHGLYEVTTVGSGGTPTQIALETENVADSVPSGWDLRYGYTTEPVLASAPLVRLPFQPFGGVGEWTADGSPLIVHNKTSSAIQLAMRSISGTSPIELRVRLELGA